MLRYAVGLLVALFALSVVNVGSARYPIDTETINEQSLLELTKHAHIIFTGTVQHKDYVYRYGIWPGRAGGTPTTDIIVSVTTMIKGEPNFGENHVKFAIEGGKFFSARKGKVIRMIVSTEPKFEVGEKVLLFLSKPKPPHSANVNFPHDGLHVHGTRWGKKKIVDNAIQTPYLKAEDQSIQVKMPLDLALNLSKAYLKDAASAIALENEIKTLARGNTAKFVKIPQATITRLKNESQTIINRRK